MTKPRATWVLWTKGKGDSVWRRFVTVAPGPVGDSGRAWLIWLRNKCVEGGVRPGRYRILPAGRKPKG